MAATRRSSPQSNTRVFVDQYTGTVLEVRPPGGHRSMGDLVVAWIGPLHTGHFGGPFVKVAWVVMGLSPAVLFVTGLLMWWQRVVGPWQRRSQRRDKAAAAA